jgi:RNA recognition motif-containing protein
LAYNDLKNREIVILGARVEISFGQPTPLPSNIGNAHNCGGTRCVVIKDIDEMMNQEYFFEICKVYGEVESIKAVREKRIVYIEFINFLSSLNFVEKILEDPVFSTKRVGFSRDRCSKQFAGEKGYNSSNRTLFIGGVSQDISSEDIFNVIKGGNVYSLKIVREKKCAFLTFMDPHSALAYLSLCNFQGLVVKGHKLRVSLGTNSNITVQSIIYCFRGATRTVVLSNTDSSITHDKILCDFGKFGELEMINFISSKRIVFINFLNITDSYLCCASLNSDPFYLNYKIGFGNDRCSINSATDIMLYLQKSKLNKGDL